VEEGGRLRGAVEAEIRSRKCDHKSGEVEVKEKQPQALSDRSKVESGKEGTGNALVLTGTGLRGGRSEGTKALGDFR
jgi:hypothetical protein